MKFSLLFLPDHHKSSSFNICSFISDTEKRRTCSSLIDPFAFRLFPPFHSGSGREFSSSKRTATLCENREVKYFLNPKLDTEKKGEKEARREEVGEKLSSQACSHSLQCLHRVRKRIPNRCRAIKRKRETPVQGAMGWRSKKLKHKTSFVLDL
jgi:hypothetical protein